MSVDGRGHGHTRFETVRDAFEHCFADLGETGAAFAAVVDGRVVADLWGGDGFARDSLVNVYSDLRLGPHGLRC